MDPQGRRQVDPADQWVFDPETGSYQLRLDPQRGAEDPPTRRVPPQPGSRRARRDQQGTPSDTGRPGAGSGSAPPASRRKPRPRQTGKKKALIWTAGSVGFALVAVSVGGYLAYQHFNGNISTVDTVGIGSKNATSDGPVNILIIGTDSRIGLGKKYGDVGSVGHADTTILFHVSKDRSNATALSIPRDIIVPNIPDCPTKQKDGTTKIIPGTVNVRFNTSLGQDGRDPGCTMRTVKELTGITPDHFMLANFQAVKDLTTAVGGVEVCLAKDIDDPGSHLKLSKGRHTVAGEQALEFVRTRDSVGFGGDLSRIQLQQQFLSSMIRKMKSGGTLSNPVKLYKLGDVATKALTVDTGIGSGKKLATLTQDLSKVDTKNITFATTPVIDNPADGVVHKTVLLDPSKAPQLFSLMKRDISLTEVKQREKAAAKTEKAAAADKLEGTKAAAADVRVEIYNGSGVFGAAQDTVSWLQNSKGVLRSTNGGNASATAPTTTLKYAPNQADQARSLAAMMGLPASALEPDTKDAAPRANMTLTLGKDFTTAGAPIVAPTKAPDGVQKVTANDTSICAK